MLRGVQQPWKLLSSQVLGIMGLVFGLVFARSDLGATSRPEMGPLGSASVRTVLVSDKRPEDKNPEMIQEQHLDAEGSEAELTQALKVAIVALLNGPDDVENADAELPPGFELEILGSQGIREEVVLHKVGPPSQTLRISRDFTLQGDLKIPHFLNLGSVSSRPGRAPAMVLANSSGMPKADRRFQNRSDRAPLRKKSRSEPLEFEGIQ
jgi:hypothetical protein